MNYQLNKEKAKTRPTMPSLTDQSQAKDTDINVIVGKYGITRRVPGAQTEPMYGDFTQLPEDLAGFIKTARSLKNRTAELPEQLRNTPLMELMGLTDKQLNDKLAPPAQPPEPKKDEPKP